MRARVGQAVAVDDEPTRIGTEELAGLGLYDPAAPDATDRLKLLRYALALGATVEQIAAAPNLGELALDLNLRPGPQSTLAEVVDDVGIEWAQAERLLTALGFPLDPDQLMTVDEAAALRLLAAACRELFGEEATVQVARVAGNAMARVAEMLVATFRLRFELPRRAAGTGNYETVQEYTDIAQTVLPAFMRTLDALLRRQILAVAGRMWSTDDEQTAVTLPRTVGFADLVGYTAASASMSVSELASVLAEFDEKVSNVVLRGNGQVVKTIGDEAMFVAESAADACRIALKLVGEFGQGRLPPVRIGLAAGDVLSVFGDVYGPDVNLAARLVAAAEPSTVVASAQVRAECAGLFRFERLPPLALKGLPDPVSAFRIDP
jgi:adenylate cyclase